jgi:hypothetical protein
MQLVNHTPFSPLTFPALDLADQELQIVVLRATYELSLDRDPSPAAVQDPVRTAPEPWAPEAPSSWRYADDLAPFKPRSDVLVTATSYAPGGRPAPEWLAGVSVGRLSKQILVTGPRVWVFAPMLGWIMGPPAPTTAIPIRYEEAFGGVAQRAGADEAYPENPLGRGWSSGADHSKPIRAPSLLRPGLQPHLGKPYPVEGFAPIHPSWQPRLARAGTFDETWVKTRQPRLPKDFDFGFYNCAHPDLVYPGWLEGGEEVRLVRLCRHSEQLCFRLPGLAVGVSMTDKAGNRCGAVARLDTVHIDCERMKLWLVWRAVLPPARFKVARIDVVATESIAAVQARAAAARREARHG